MSRDALIEDMIAAGVENILSSLDDPTPERIEAVRRRVRAVYEHPEPLPDAYRSRARNRRNPTTS